MPRHRQTFGTTSQPRSCGVHDIRELVSTSTPEAKLQGFHLPSYSLTNLLLVAVLLYLLLCSCWLFTAGRLSVKRIQEVGLAGTPAGCSDWQ